MSDVCKTCFGKGGHGEPDTDQWHWCPDCDLHQKYLDRKASSKIAPCSEAEKLRKAIREAFDLFTAADEQRLEGVQDAHTEAEKWKAEGDMYGWNFHQGKAGGMTEASIIFYRVFRRLKVALKDAE